MALGSSVSLGAGGVGVDLARATRQAAESVIDLTDDILDLTLYANPRSADIGGDHFAPVMSEDGVMRPVTLYSALVRVPALPEPEPTPPDVALEEEMATPGEHMPARSKPARPTTFLDVPIADLPHLHILWVDDRDDLVAFERRGLMRGGHHVTAVRDTTEALRTLREQGFDVVVSDAERGGNPRAWDKLGSEIRARRVKRRFSDDPIPFAVYTVADKAAAIRTEFLAAGPSTGWSSWAFSSYTALRWRLIWVQVQARIRKG